MTETDNPKALLSGGPHCGDVIPITDDTSYVEAEHPFGSNLYVRSSSVTEEGYPIFEYVPNRQTLN